MIRGLVLVVGGGGRGRGSLGGRRGGAGAGGGVSLQPMARRLDTRLIVRPTTKHKHISNSLIQCCVRIRILGP